MDQKARELYSTPLPLLEVQRDGDHGRKQNLGWRIGPGCSKEKKGNGSLDPRRTAWGQASTSCLPEDAETSKSTNKSLGLVTLGCSRRREALKDTKPHKERETQERNQGSEMHRRFCRQRVSPRTSDEREKVKMAHKATP